MNWAYRTMVSPAVWAIAFAALYALHGYGCAKGWQATPALGSDLHRVSMVLGYLAALGATGGIFLLGRRHSENQLVTLGDMIGFGATLLTLWPVVSISSCFA